MRRRPVLVVGSVLVLALAGCGGDGDGDDASAGAPGDADQELADAITASLIADDQDGFGEVFDTTCMGREIVAAFGGAEAAEAEYGITAERVAEEGNLIDEIELSREGAEQLLSGYEQCGDFEDLLRVSFISAGATETQADCVLDALPDRAMQDALLEDFQAIGAGPATQAMDDALAAASAACVDN